MSESIDQLNSHLSAAVALAQEIEAEMRRMRLAQKAEKSKRFLGNADPDSKDELFKLLGLSPSDGQAEIKTAYRRMASVWHPDRPGGNRQVFERISSAAATLTQR